MDIMFHNKTLGNNKIHIWSFNKMYTQ